MLSSMYAIVMLLDMSERCYPHVTDGLRMTINYGKTAILLKLTGKEASRRRRDHTFKKAGQRDSYT